MSVMAIPPLVLGVLEALPDEARRLLARVSRQWIRDVLGNRSSARLEGVIIGLEPDQVDELLPAAGSPGQARVRWLPAALDEDRRDPSSSQPEPGAEREAVECGCAVPGCPHSGCSQNRPGVVRAFELRAGELTPLCPTHWRALARERLHVEWLDQPRWHARWTSHTPEIIGENDLGGGADLSLEQANWLVRRRRWGRSPPVPA